MLFRSPVPGYPMGGYSVSGKSAIGVLNRLYVRSLYIKDKEGSPLILAALDMWSIPGGLGDRVTEILNESGLKIGRG